jgi:hypothetical protein
MIVSAPLSCLSPTSQTPAGPPEPLFEDPVTLHLFAKSRLFARDAILGHGGNTSTEVVAVAADVR